MKRFLGALGLLLIACSQSHPAASASAQSSPSWSPVTSPKGPRIDLSCRLPIVTSSIDTGVVTLHGGFIQFPENRLVADPAATIGQSDAYSDFATAAAPILHGQGGAFYDRARSRWVPAAPEQSLPDGSAYAYIRAEPRTNLVKAYVVNVSSGTVRTFALPNASTLWQVVDYNSTGIYILEFSALGGPNEGVWLLNPTTGSVNLLRQVHQVWLARDGYAWAARFDPLDKTPPPPYTELAPANSLVRIDLATGAETTWFYRAGAYPWLVGLDAHQHPVVNLPDEVRLIDAPGAAGQFVDSQNGVLTAPLGDGDRIWFGGQHGIYMYRAGSGLQRVYAYESDPSNPSYVAPAGLCL